MMLAAAMAATVLVCPSPSNVFTVPARHENRSVVIVVVVAFVVIIIIIIIITLSVLLLSVL